MLQYIKLAEFPPDTDTGPVTRALEQGGIAFQVVEEDGLLVLYVDSDAHIGDVVSLVRKATETIQHQQEDIGLRPMPSLRQQFQRTPVLVLALVFSILGAFLVSWRFDLVHWFSFQDFVIISPREITFSTFAEGWGAGQWWRLITPIFLHFGIFHIVFNGLWLWEFGRRIETLTGSGHFLMLVLVTGVLSNYSQYVWSGPSLFGGMSGVLYGLLGYIWIRNLVAPAPGLKLPRGIVGFMLAWLVICMTGIIGFLFGAGIANAAHLSGLLAGMLLGLVFGLGARSAVLS